jgi:hypothetical protein
MFKRNNQKADDRGRRLDHMIEQVQAVPVPHTPPTICPPVKEPPKRSGPPAQRQMVRRA